MRENITVETTKWNQTERAVADALRDQVPVKDLPGVSIQDVREQPEQAFDISFQLRSGSNRVQVLGEIKQTVSPRMLQEIAPWIRRLKSLRRDVSVAVIAPTLSPQAQAFCVKNGIDFMDLAGNVFINLPGKFTLQRSGMRARGVPAQESEGQRALNVFSGRSSRVLRVLLENPKSWTVTEIARELSAESKRSSSGFPQATRIDFEISIGSVSKAIASLEEQLWVRRRGTAVVVPEPRRLLEQWAEKYKERYRWRLRSSFQTNNPFGYDLVTISQGLKQLIPGPYAFSGAAAAAETPFVDLDIVDVFLLAAESDVRLRNLKSQPGTGPTLRFTYPFDVGVFMYLKIVREAPVVSAIQAYLDLYARGGRDLKQAEYLLTNAIERRWEVV
ncbi:MAG: hypothetical protein HY652_00705 [Acidobacteria bacterium]|nr:hypothetical protein [Acidobacteriota bacterium]